MSKMPEAKRTCRTKEEVLALDEHIALKRGELVAAREQVPLLEEEVVRLHDKAETLNERWQKRAKLDVLEAAERLKEEIRVLKSMQREHYFETKVVSYLKRYRERDNMKELKRKQDIVEEYVSTQRDTARKQTHLIDEYLTELKCTPAKVEMTDDDVCPKCTTKKALLLCVTRSILSCPDCGYAITYLDATSNCTSFDDCIDFSQYSYKRINHYSLTLALIQGKETHRVSDHILHQIMLDLYNANTSFEDITLKKIRECVKRLKLKEVYDNVAQVYYRITGKRPPRVSAETESQLKNMFLKMQPVFQRHAPRSRTNFLSYNYVLYRSFQILGLDYMLENVPLLKGRDKLEANDQIFKKMCKDLGWPIFELPPCET